MAFHSLNKNLPRAIIIACIGLILSFSITESLKSQDITLTKMPSATDFKYWEDENKKEWPKRMKKETISWLRDELTMPYANKTKKWGDDSKDYKKGRNRFNGLRLVFEPNFGPLILQEANKITQESFLVLPKFGLETNLHTHWTGLQVVVFYPGIVEFDNQSPIKNHLVADEDGSVSVDVEFGYSIALTFIDGLLVVGWGKLIYDDRDFKPNTPDWHKRDEFFYFGVQPITAVRKLIKKLK